MKKEFDHSAPPRASASVSAAARAAKPPLDLSLGHIGTTDAESVDDDASCVFVDDDSDGPDVDDSTHGHLYLVVNHDLHTALLRRAVGVAPGNLSKVHRQRIERQLRNKLARLSAEGYTVDVGGLL